MFQCFYHLKFSLSSFSYDNAFKVEQDASQSGKKGYADFKRAVWHNSFHELLESIQKLSKIGYHIGCHELKFYSPRSSNFVLRFAT